MPGARKIRTIGAYSLHLIRVLQHTATHVAIGIIYVLILKNTWHTISNTPIFLAAFGSILIDLDHVFYIFTYGRREWYAIESRKFMRQGQFKNLAYFLRTHHKHNTGLATHNVYYLAFFLLLSLLSFKLGWETGIVLF